MMKRHLSASLHVGLFCGIATVTLVQAQPPHQPAPTQEPSSSPRIRISPTVTADDTSSIEIASDHWTAHGYDLKSLIAEIYDVDPLRIELPDNAVTTVKYDVSLALTEDASEEEMHHLLQQALQNKLRITITPETRALDVYIITAPHGPGPALHPHRGPEDADGDADRFSYQARVCPGISSGGITASAGTISEFRRTLEPTLDRPLINESNLPGRYDFQIGQYRSKEELFQLLRSQLGLVLVPSQRKVTVLAVHPS